MDPTAKTPSPGPIGPLAPGEPFGSRYRILSVLGAGGMGVVYKAFDDELDVAVALKVIRPEVLTDPEAARGIERRFKRELLLAREVTHRNVVRIHDLGDIGGIKYISMPFIEGQSLASVIAHEGALPLDRALAIARQVADGLAAAHEAGVVHRDLKPENVMIAPDDHALIMDFGISRSAAGTTALATATGTAAGAVVGTLEYMAPEQANGQTVDQRADIYALGLMLYDMLQGRHRVANAGSAVAEMMARFQTPPRARTRGGAGSTVPPAIDALIARAIAADPARRYQTVAEFLHDLDKYEGRGGGLSRRRVLAWGAAAGGAALVLAGLAATGTWFVASRRAPAAAVERPPVSIVISDFENHTGDPLFQGSVEQALAIAMEGAPFITSYPRASALSAAAQLGRTSGTLDEGTARLVAQREGLKVVLAGTVDATNGSYKVAVRAIDAVPGTVLADASEVAATKADVLQAVGRVASRVRQALGDVTPESERLAAAETFSASSLEAASAYAAAQQLMSNGKYRDSIVEYRRATDIDPNFGRAYAAWAVCAYQTGDKAEAERLYRKAFGLLDRMTERERYRTYGAYYLTVAENYGKAIESCSRLVTLYPADRSGHSNLALAYFYTLNFPKALEHGRRAIEIYRGSPKFRSNYALYAMYAGDFPTASQVATSLTTENPRYGRAYIPIAMAAFAKGDLAGARSAYERMKTTDADGASFAAMGLADLAMYSGDCATAAAVLRPGAEADGKNKNTAGLAAKRVALAEALFLSGDAAAAATEARAASALSRSPQALYPAARLLVRTRRIADAKALAAPLGQDIQPDHRAYARLIESDVAIAEHRPADAVTLATEAQKLADVWLARFALGVAYVEAGAFGDAIPEFEACLRRRGEVSAVFLDDQPSVRYLPPVYYWLGRAQEGFGVTARAAERYRLFLTLRPEPSRDPLARDARRRVTAQ